MQTPVQIVDSEVISQLALGHTHGGFLAVCTQRSFSSLQKSNIRPSGFYIMLEGIEDPYNFGYALRSVYAAGADGVVLSPRNWMSAAGVVCRSSAGASELLETFIAEGEAAVEAFSACHYQIVCADKRGSVSVFDANLHKPLLLIVGGEKRGISKGLLQACSQCVQLEYGEIFPPPFQQPLQHLSSHLKSCGRTGYPAYSKVTTESLYHVTITLYRFIHQEPSTGISVARSQNQRYLFSAARPRDTEILDDRTAKAL